MNRWLLPSLARCLAQDEGWRSVLGKATALPPEAPGLSAQVQPECALAGAQNPPWAVALARAAGLSVQAGERWLALEPLCLRVAPNGIYVVAAGDFGQSHDEMQALWTEALPLLTESGLTFAGQDGLRAYVRLAPTHSDPDTACAEDVLGAELTPCMPGERGWRLLLNELQMAWAAHPVNVQRLAVGQWPINSAWLGRVATGSQAPALPAPITLRSADPLLHALGQWAGWTLLADVAPAAALRTSAPVLWDVRAAPETALRALHAGWGTPALLRFACGARYRLASWHRWRFWRRPLPQLDADLQPASPATNR